MRLLTSMRVMSMRASATPTQKCTPCPKPRMFVRIAANIEPERVGEDVFVAVGCGL